MNKRMRYSVVIGLACTAFFCGMSVSSDTVPKVAVNGRLVDGEAILQNDRVYVPIRAVGEALGADVSWDDSTKTAQVWTRGDEDASAMIADVSQSVVAIVGNYRGADVTSDKVEAMVHGTGVIIKSGGEILTNAHVVKDLEQIIVVMHDGLGYEARLKYMDEDVDLAVIKIDRIGLPAIQFADATQLVTGRTVYAIGTPISFSMRNAASRGIISGVNSISDYPYRLIHTDAAINPGNSGGPLVNAAGQLVGINSSKLAGIGVEGMGFSIPVDTVQYVLEQFEAYGRLIWPNTGLTFDESWASRIGLPTQEGLRIVLVANGSAGERAGLQPGDSVTKVCGIDVHSVVDYNEAMKHASIGGDANITFQRGAETMIVALRLEE